MVSSDFRTKRPPKALLYSLADSPHATIESNRNCNMTCHVCYNLERSHVKTLDEIADEIGIALGKRNLSVITILGGEPTLHPQLSEIVAMVKSRGLTCQLLTNGLAFLQDNGDRLLTDLINADIDKIVLHVDSGQGLTPDECEKRRQALFSKLEAKKKCFSLALTIYNDDLEAIPEAIRKYSCFSFFDGVLAVLARNNEPDGEQNVQMLEVYQRIDARLGIEPVAFIPSSRDQGDVSWLKYMFYINSRSGSVYAVSPLLNRIFRKLYRLIVGRHFFVVNAKFRIAKLKCLTTCILESLIHPMSFLDLVKLLRHSSWLKNIRFHYIAVQEPPQFDSQGNLVKICRHCPDATIRQGKLTPICLADYISPLNGAEETIRQDWRQIIYKHLGESV